MSMSEFEDVVEQSIRLLATSPQNQPHDLRTIFWNLYQFQNNWDTSFTHFRVIDILVEHRLMYRFALTDHPEYQTYRRYFDGLKKFEFINALPSFAWDSWDNPVAGYFHQGHLYCEAGSYLWKLFVDNGRLSGADALSPQAMPLIDIVAIVLSTAETRENRELIRMWYPLLAAQLSLFEQQETPAELFINLLSNKPAIQTIRTITQRTQALTIPMNRGATAFPSTKEQAADPFMAWWFGL